MGLLASLHRSTYGKSPGRSKGSRGWLRAISMDMDTGNLCAARYGLEVGPRRPDFHFVWAACS